MSFLRRYRQPQETDTEWALRSHFLEANWSTMPLDELLQFSHTMVDVRLYGAEYPPEVMQRLWEMATKMNVAVQTGAWRDGQGTWSGARGRMQRGGKDTGWAGGSWNVNNSQGRFAENDHEPRRALTQFERGSGFTRGGVPKAPKFQQFVSARQDVQSDWKTPESPPSGPAEGGGRSHGHGRTSTGGVGLNVGVAVGSVRDAVSAHTHEQADHDVTEALRDFKRTIAQTEGPVESLYRSEQSSDSSPQTESTSRKRPTTALRGELGKMFKPSAEIADDHTNATDNYVIETRSGDPDKVTEANSADAGNVTQLVQSGDTASLSTPNTGGSLKNVKTPPERPPMSSPALPPSARTPVQYSSVQHDVDLPHLDPQFLDALRSFLLTDTITSVGGRNYSNNLEQSVSFNRMNWMFEASEVDVNSEEYWAQNRALGNPALGQPVVMEMWCYAGLQEHCIARASTTNRKTTRALVYEAAFKRLQDYCWTVEVRPEESDISAPTDRVGRDVLAGTPSASKSGSSGPTGEASEDLAAQTDDKAAGVEEREQLLEKIKRTESRLPNSNVGARLMQLMGYKGGGLGKDGKGIAEPIQVEQVVRRAGLGLEKRTMNAGGSSRQGSSMQTSVADFRRTMHSVIERYAASAEATELVFSSEWSKEERAMLHQIGQKFGLRTQSRGKGEQRYLTISRRFSPDSLMEHLKAKGGQTNKYRLVPPREL